MSTLYLLEIFFINKLFLFVISFIMSFFLLFFLTSGLLGNRIKIFFEELVHNRNLTIYLLILSLMIILVIVYLDFNTIYCAGEDKVTVKAENITFNIFGLSSFASGIGNTAAFTSGIGAAAKLLKNSSYPMGFKYLLVGVGGVSSVLLWDTTKRVTNLNQEIEQIDVNAYKPDSSNSVDVTAKFKKSTTGDSWEEFMEDYSIHSPLEAGDLANFNQLLDILDNVILLNSLMVLTSLLCILFFTFKFISEKEIEFHWLNKFYFAKKIRSGLRLIISMWGKTNILWGFYSLFLILIVLSFNSYVLFILSQQFHSIFS